MGRANRPVRSVAPADVGGGDVVLIRYPHVPNSRWLLVDHVSEHSAPHVWFGRWAFGADAGTRASHRATESRYTVKDARDAARDHERLVALPRNAHT